VDVMVALSQSVSQCVCWLSGGAESSGMWM